MPTIIGNSTIHDQSGNTGPTGNVGPIGPTGSISSVAGPTGTTGTYISIINTDSTRNTLTFVGSNGSNISILQGFTGPTGYYSDSRGISAAILSGYFSGLSGVISGNTFQFLGICGSGLLTSSLSADKTEILITPNVLASSASYGSTLPNSIVYTDSNYSATTTKISITGSNSILSFGLTAHGGATGSSVKVFTDFNEIYFNITGGITLGFTGGITLDSVVTGYDSGGLVMDLTKYTTYKINSPIGITAFTSNTDTKALQSYTLFIDGAEVWNFPKNVYFENTNLGVSGYGFLNGMNIVHLWSDNAGITFNAAFVARGLGEENDIVYSSLFGSCCYIPPIIDVGDPNPCKDYITLRECDILGGNFYPLKPCSETCNIIGSCCSEHICYAGVKLRDCDAIGGVFSEYNCLDIDCEPIVVYTYDMIISENPDILVLPNSSKLFTITIETTDINPVYVDFPRQISSTPPGTFFKFTAKLPDGTAINSQVEGDPLTELLPGTTLGFYFDNTTLPSADGSSGTLPIQLKDSTGSIKDQINMPVVHYKDGQLPGCSGCANATRVGGEFELMLMCDDCYSSVEDGREHNKLLAVQYGYINFCVGGADSGCGFTYAASCIRSGNVIDSTGGGGRFHYNFSDCKITDANTGSDLCAHRLYGAFSDVGPTVCVDACTTAAKGNLVTTGSHCKGANRDDGTSSYSTMLQLQPDITYKLLTMGIRVGFNPMYQAIARGIENDVAGAQVNGEPLFFNKNNQGSGITFKSDSTVCCSPRSGDTGTPALDFSNPDRKYFVYLFYINDFKAYTGKTTVINPGGLGTANHPCYDESNEMTVYTVIVSAELNPDGSMKAGTYCAITLRSAWCQLGFLLNRCNPEFIEKQKYTYGYKYIGEIKESDTAYQGGNIWFVKYNTNRYNPLGDSCGLQDTPDAATRFQDITTCPFIVNPAAGLTNKGLREAEFFRYFWQPTLCDRDPSRDSNDGFGPLSCAASSTNQCSIRFEREPWQGGGDMGGLEDIDINTVCAYVNPTKVLNINKTLNENNRIISVTPTVYNVSTNGDLTADYGARIFVSAFQDTYPWTVGSEAGNNMNSVGSGMEVMSSGATITVGEPCCQADWEFYFIYTGSTNITQSPPVIASQKIRIPFISSPENPKVEFYEPSLFIRTTSSLQTDALGSPTGNIEFVVRPSENLGDYIGKEDTDQFLVWTEKASGGYNYDFWTNGTDVNPHTFIIPNAASTLKLYTDTAARRYVKVHALVTRTYISTLGSGELLARHSDSVSKVYIDPPPAGLLEFFTPINTQTKKINNQCVSIDCVGIESYCADLEDC